ncbi:glycosyltransferase family 2 protein [Paenibacillus macerans]|uniref:glycosyltransferase family 2 protein n=1 Tax=Paenibacillus macerans TaxID=44252 RepID=UPI0022E798B1|nr:glycosyltransferase family 2 protein [Paenibacillus macerans]
MDDIKVQVLLSTFNGERYLDEQINSILKQDGVDWHLLIRDDGSSDQTKEKLNWYYERNRGKIELIYGENIGVPASFFNLIEHSTDMYDYYAFCDQDDVWDNKKLFHAVDMLRMQAENIPLMYCSSTTMVDPNLNFLKVWPEPPKKRLTIFNSLIENIAVGCTIVLNREAMMLIKSSMPRTLKNVIMHDWWGYLCTSAFGKVIFDSKPSILYRQHSLNVVGGQKATGFQKWKERLRRFRSGKNHYILSRQTAEFLECFGDSLKPEQKKEIERFLSFKDKNMLTRFLYALSSPFYRQSFIDDLVYKVVYTIGKI